MGTKFGHEPATEALPRALGAVRAIATDLDGTIVRSDGDVSARTRDALAAAEDAGLLVVFVTGRPPRWMKPVSEATGHHGLAVCANGALVYDLHTEQVVQEHPIDAEVVRTLAAALGAALPGLAFAVERTAAFGHEPGFRPRQDMPPDVLVADLELLLDQPVVKLLARHEDLTTEELYERANEVVGDLADLVTITFGGSSNGLIEVSAVGVTKAFGLERLLAEHGIGAEDVVAFGDMPNDLPMLAWAGHAVAVANAHPDVLAAADEVTASNDDDGVALVVERLVATRCR
jgi:Cof subfamily protein (haloacid dehalogenase superfamily)